MDWLTRYEHCEFFSMDSIKLDENLRYSTRLGRPVYGGGGIMPDVFVPQDTTGTSSYLIEVLNKGLTLQFSFQYSDRNRAKLNEFENEEDMLKDDGEFVILKRETIDGEEMLCTIEDDDEYDAVGNKFLQYLTDMFDEEDEEEA